MKLIKKLFIIVSLFSLSIICSAQDFWIKQQTPENFHAKDIASDLDSKLFIGTSDGIYSGDSYGENIVKIGLDNTILSVAVNNNDEIYAGSGPIFYSNDSGNNWTEISTPSNVHTIFINDDKIFYGYWGGIYSTTDLGVNWNSVLETDYSEQITCIIQKDFSTYFAGSIAWMGGGGVYKSIDGGLSWSLVGLSDYYIQSLECDAQGRLYAGSIGNEGIGIFMSNDDGETWTSLKTDVFVSSILITDDNVIYIGCTNEHSTQGGVFRSFDFGSTWELINSGLTGITNQDVDGLCLSKNGYLYCYGDHLHRSLNPVISSILDNSLHYKNISLFPNPSDKYIYLSANEFFQFNQNFKLEIFNSSGKCVYAINIDNNWNQTIDVGNFSNGLYLVKIEFDNTKVLLSFIKTNR